MDISINKLSIKTKLHIIKKNSYSIFVILLKNILRIKGSLKIATLQTYIFFYKIFKETRTAKIITTSNTLQVLHNLHFNPFKIRYILIKLHYILLKSFMLHRILIIYLKTITSY